MSNHFVVIHRAHTSQGKCVGQTGVDFRSQYINTNIFRLYIYYIYIYVATRGKPVKWHFCGFDVCGRFRASYMPLICAGAMMLAALYCVGYAIISDNVWSANDRAFGAEWMFIYLSENILNVCVCLCAPLEHVDYISMCVYCVNSM